MTDARRHDEDLRAVTELVVEAVLGVTTIAEDMHRTIGSGPAALGAPLARPADLVTRVSYGAVKKVTGLVGATLDRALATFGRVLGQSTPGPEREALLAALNGVLGDQLAARESALALPLRFRRRGGTSLDPASLAGPLGPRLLLLVHGSCMNDRQWRRADHDHGEMMEAAGWTPVYVSYNSGRHVGDNGEELAAALEKLVAAWPVPLTDLAFLAHSMGGLVSRSACHAAEAAGYAWRAKLRSMVFLGTPHHGAPLEKGGNGLDVLLGLQPVTAPLARLGKIRSAGVTDLRFGRVLTSEARGRFEPGPDDRVPVPLPKDVRCGAVAGRLGAAKAGATRLSELRGDGLVPVRSALGQHENPAFDLAMSERATLEGLDHLALLSDPAVAETVRRSLVS
ncbi:MAG: alpha/beta hydrolase [Myxococcota bacterium]